MDSQRRSLVYPLLLLLVAWPVERVPGADVPREVREKLGRDGEVHVFLLLERPPASTSTWEQKEMSFRQVQERVTGRLPAKGLDVRYRYRFSPALLVRVRSVVALEQLSDLPEVAAVELDVSGRGALDQSRDLIGADEVFDQGITGEGRVVAVLDSGVDTDHPDFTGAVIHEYHFLDQGAVTGPGAEDDHGHGSHVAGIIASRGIRAPRGMAPGTSLVAIKVLNEENRGWLSDWARGVEHVIDLHEEDNGIQVDAINMSLVSNAEFQGVCDASFGVFSSACRRATELGIAVFASSGNTASTINMTSPACLGYVISVGSVADNLPDRISSFTSRNRYLDLLAPGESITSVGLGGGTSTRSGTSMACPHAVGLASLLREVEPSASPHLLLSTLKVTGVPVLDPGSDRVFPRIDALAAVEAIADTEDCNADGQPDWLDIASGVSADCNENDVPDECDIAGGASVDGDGDGIPDECQARPVFHRGDPNDDGEIDLSDGIFIFTFLFLGGSPPGCLESADVNVDDEIDLSDGISILTWLFIGGPPPAPPGPPGSACGEDPDPAGSPGDLGCEVYESC